MLSRYDEWKLDNQGDIDNETERRLAQEQAREAWADDLYDRMRDEPLG